MKLDTTPFLLLCLTSLAGCTGVQSLQVRLPGTDHGQPALGGSSAALSFTSTGHPRVYDRPVDLPRAQEDARYGVVLIDTRPLPAGWRAEADDGGVVVSAVDWASPLARAGLRAGDQIESVDDVAAESPEQVVELLSARDSVALAIQRTRSYDAGRFTVEAEAEPDLQENSVWALPGVITLSTSNTGTGFSLGPVGAICAGRSALVTDGVRYVERTEWAFLFDWFAYRSETDVATGEVRRRFTLFWFLDFGDDAAPY